MGQEVTGRKRYSRCHPKGPEMVVVGVNPGPWSEWFLQLAWGRDSFRE